MKIEGDGGEAFFNAKRCNPEFFCLDFFPFLDA